MGEYDLLGGLKLKLENNILALTSETEVTVVSSAVYNGGLGKAKAALNVQVPKPYDQKLLHEHPEQIILKAVEKLGLDPKLSVGMITAADVEKFSMATMSRDNLTVSAIATAGCSLAETAGENIEASLTLPGTINIMVAVDGNPTESCLLQSFITATEAKTASLRDLDVRSTYTGDLATGTITDSLAIVSTNRGPTIRYGGPASKLGRLVGYCTREAVKSAILKSGNMSPTRSVWKRLSERKLPMEKLVTEISKTSHAKANVEEIIPKITREPLLALVLMMAAKVDEEINKGLIPEEFGDINALTERFTRCFFKTASKEYKIHKPVEEYANSNTYPFLKSLLFACLKSNHTKK
ncbi:MAG: adenosylcobinamide amidohydrolase [Candidatus Bathyarchaeia archaeon]